MWTKNLCLYYVHNKEEVIKVLNMLFQYTALYSSWHSLLLLLLVLMQENCSIIVGLVHPNSNYSKMQRNNKKSHLQIEKEKNKLRAGLKIFE